MSGLPDMRKEPGATGRPRQRGKRQAYPAPVQTIRAAKLAVFCNDVQCSKYCVEFAAQFFLIFRKAQRVPNALPD